MTEKEAAMKICPFIADMAHSLNGGVCCATTHCMAWQSYESVAFKVRDEHYFRLSGERLVSDEGYCARLGKPAEAE
jgi:hypothetical protein